MNPGGENIIVIPYQDIENVTGRVATGPGTERIPATSVPAAAQPHCSGRPGRPDIPWDSDITTCRESSYTGWQAAQIRYPWPGRCVPRSPASGHLPRRWRFLLLASRCVIAFFFEAFILLGEPPCNRRHRFFTTIVAKGCKRLTMQGAGGEERRWHTRRCVEKTKARPPEGFRCLHHRSRALVKKTRPIQQ